ncbi:alpha/beta hydrolase family protein [Burkholderiaceae bacterium UC74_6]
MRRLPARSSLAALAALALLSALGGAAPARAESGFAYQQPAPAVRELLDAPALPRTSVSPDRQTLALIEQRRFSSIDELSRPVLRLAGLRFEPGSGAAQSIAPILKLRLRSLLNPDAPERAVELPATGTLHGFAWAPDGRRFVLMRRLDTGTELWVGEVGSARVQPVAFVRVNPVLLPEVHWLGAHELVVATVPERRGPAPQMARVPTGPAVQESRGIASPERTYQDLLSDPQDEALFEYHARSTLTRVDIATGFARDIGTPALYSRVLAVGEAYLLTERLTRPFSYSVAWDGFPRVVELRTRDGKLVRELAKLPLRQGVSVDGVSTGPRSFQASPFADGAIYWVEALDGGNNAARATHRDRLMRLDPPYTADAQEVLRMAYRYTRLAFLDDGRNSTALLTETDRARNWLRTWLLPLRNDNRAEKGAGAPRLLFEFSSREKYHHPGTPMTYTLPNGRNVVLVDHGDLLMTGPGASPKGERPFLDRLDLKDGSTTRIFQSGEDIFEQVLSPLEGGRWLTQRESQTEPPNLFLRDGTGLSALTRLKDPSPQLRKLKRELVSFKRADGVELSFWLVLPPDYKPGERRPALVWAYPLEFPDRTTASQVAGSNNRFSQPSGLSPLLLAMEGYVVLMDAAMPIVGDARAVNDGFIEQLLMNAHAILDKADELGSVDLHRVAVGGHSYGAFMTATLLAYSDNLFRCGIARSGAYNRTLTPFGFQSERRTLWEARDTYLRLSPFLLADRIKEPLLLTHGEADNNAGTFPIQSERLYAALAGTGGTVRYVALPFEAHNYTARESVGHVQWEMARWLRQCLGDPKAPNGNGAASGADR